MQGSDIGDVLRKEKTPKFWPSKFRDYVLLGTFMTAIIVGGNALLHSARPETEVEVTVEAKKKNKRLFYERWIYHGSKSAEELYERFLGDGGTPQPADKRDGYLTNNK